MGLTNWLFGSETAKKNNKNISTEDEYETYEFFEGTASYKNREEQEKGYRWSAPEDVLRFSNHEEKTIVLDKFAYSSEVIEEIAERNKGMFSSDDDTEIIKRIQKIETIETRLSPTDFTQSMVYVGAMGSGKTVAIETVLAQSFYHRAIVNDYKGDYVEKFYKEGKDIIISLYDNRGQVWDIFGEMKYNPDISFAFVSNLMKEAVGGKEDFFLNSAIKVVSEAFIEANYNKDCHTSVQKWNKLIEIVDKYRNSVADDKAKSSIALTLDLGLETFRLINYRISNGAKTFTLEEFFNRKDGVKMFILNNQAYVKKLKPFNTGFLGAVISVLSGKPDNVPDTPQDYTFFLIDEYYSVKLSQESKISLFTGIRSKGGQLLIGFQYFSDSKEEKQLLDSSRYGLVICRVADGTTVKRLIEMMGKTEYTEESHSRSGNGMGKNSGGGGGMGNVGNTIGSLGSGFAYSTSTSVKQSNFLTEEIVQSMDKHHHITILPAEKIAYLGKTDFLNLPKINENFELMDMDTYYKTIFDHVINKEEHSLVAHSEEIKARELSEMSEKERFVFWINLEFPQSGTDYQKYIIDNGLQNIDVEALYREFSENKVAIEEAKEMYSRQEDRLRLMNEFFALKSDEDRFVYAKENFLIGSLLAIFALEGDFIKNELGKIL